MQVCDLGPGDEAAIGQVAQILVDGFKEHWPDAYPTLESAFEEIHESLAPGHISLVAVDEVGHVLGWVGGQHNYARVWELHPLVVRPDRQRRGVGRALVTALEARVRERGGLTVMLGSDDEDKMTTLSGVDLYQDTWRHVASIENLRGHPYAFYQKLGYTIVGVVPDANGPGKPDILMAKRVAEE